MIFRTWTAKQEYPTDETVRQIWRSADYHRQFHQAAGDRDVYSYGISNPVGNKTISLWHKWENNDTGDFDFFAHTAEAQYGDVLTLTQGERFNVEVRFDSLGTSHYSDCYNEWGWSEYRYEEYFDIIIDVGAEREWASIWKRDYGSVQGGYTQPIVSGTWRGLTREFGPVPHDGVYIVWFGLRSYFWAFMNDYSLESETHSLWKLKDVKIIQTPSQAVD